MGEEKNRNDAGLLQKLSFAVVWPLHLERLCTHFGLRCQLRCYPAGASLDDWPSYEFAPTLHLGLAALYPDSDSSDMFVTY